jgi:hypothetical protein
LKPLPVVKRMQMENLWCLCRSGTTLPTSLCRFDGKRSRKRNVY